MLEVREVAISFKFITLPPKYFYIKDQEKLGNHIELAIQHHLLPWTKERSRPLEEVLLHTTLSRGVEFTA